MSCYECVFKVLLITELLPTDGKKKFHVKPFSMPVSFIQPKGRRAVFRRVRGDRGRSRACVCLLLIRVRGGPGHVWSCTRQNLNRSESHPATGIRLQSSNFPELCFKCFSKANLQISSINQNVKPVCSIFTQLTHVGLKE